MAKQTLIPPPLSSDQAEALLLGLITDSRAVIRDVLAPAARDAPRTDDCVRHVQSIVSLMEAGAKLADAILRLRGGVPEAPPEVRQRITIERVQAVPHLSTGEGRGV